MQRRIHDEILSRIEPREAAHGFRRGRSVESFAVHHHKTRVMRQGVRQHLCGAVVNQRPNIARDEYDRLKAILTNCARHGPASQNREQHPDLRAHLQGRVAFVSMIHPDRGERLRALLRAVSWP